MLTLLLPLVKYVISKLLERIDDKDLMDEQLAEICIDILKVAVRLTRTKADDKLLEVAVEAFREKDIEPEYLEINCPEK